MYKIEINPENPVMLLKENSIVEFTIGEEKYYGRVDNDSVHDDEWFLFTKKFKTISQEDFVSAVFAPLGVTAEEYYTRVLGNPGNGGTWPQTSFNSLVSVLAHMKQDYDKLNKPFVDSSKFRFRVGDTILYNGRPHLIVGYYFEHGFNNFEDHFGYVIKINACWHNGSDYGYDEYGNHLPKDGSIDKYYLYECEAKPSSESQLTSNNQLKIKENGNAIKLQRTKASIRRGKVPTGSRICSKIHKAAVSSQYLGYKQVTC